MYNLLQLVAEIRSLFGATGKVSPSTTLSGHLLIIAGIGTYYIDPQLYEKKCQSWRNFNTDHVDE